MVRPVSMANLTVVEKEKAISQFASPVRRMRKKVFLTQEDLAYKVGFAVSTVRRWEHEGKANEPTFTVAQMRRFCDALRVDFADLPDSLLPENIK